MSALLELADVDAFYGASQVLHGVSLRVQPGEAVLLLGRNGAGKTTLMRAIMGLVSLPAGQVRFRSRDITGCDPHTVARLGIGLVPEDRRMFAALTVAQNLELGRKPAADAERGGWNLDRVLGLFPALRLLHDRRAGNLSGGQQQMVAIARTLLGNPSLLLLDEPAEGLAPVIVEELTAQFMKLRQQGMSMVVSEQNLSFARSLSDRVYILETGCVRYHGTPSELDANQQAWTKYVAF